MSLSTLVPLFHPSETLESDSQTKKVSLLGTIEGKKAILQLERRHFDRQARIPNSNIVQAQSNDVYYWGTGSIVVPDVRNEHDTSTTDCKINLIYPASEAHIAKYRKHPLHIVIETPEAYEKIVRPYIETQKGDRLSWVRNILFHGQEAERVVFKNDDYILLPDMKWDGTTIDALYLVAIVFRDDIASVRDLNKSHIPYLEAIKSSILENVPAKYPIPRDQLRLYVHYQPSFYHFHIHVVNSNYTGMGQTILAGKAILLEEVIESLKLLGKDGFAKKTITYGLSESHDLWNLGMREYTQ